MSERPRRSRICALLLFVVLLTLTAGAGARGDNVAGDNVRIGFQASILPRVLPRLRPAPVSLRVAGTVQPVDGQSPAALEQLAIQVNRHAVFASHGLPRCPPHKLRGTNDREAIANCGDALIGSGYFTSNIKIPELAPFPAWGRVLAFNSRKDGHQAVALHVFGRKPTPTTTVLSAALTRSATASGPFGPQLTIVMPKIGENWGYVSGFGLTLHRRYDYRGKQRSVIRASCPAPVGLQAVPFKAARGTFELIDGETLTRTLGGSCKAAVKKPAASRSRPTNYSAFRGGLRWAGLR